MLLYEPFELQLKLIGFAILVDENETDSVGKYLMVFESEWLRPDDGDRVTEVGLRAAAPGRQVQGGGVRVPGSGCRCPGGGVRAVGCGRRGPGRVTESSCYDSKVASVFHPWESGFELNLTDGWPIRRRMIDSIVEKIDAYLGFQ